MVGRDTGDAEGSVLAGAVGFDPSIPCQVFSVSATTLHDGHRPYPVPVCGPSAGVPASGVGVDLFRIQPPYPLAEAARCDTVLVPGMRGGEWQRRVVDVLRAAHAAGARIASICTGAFVLAEARLLEGRRATTHWAHAADLAARFPAVDVDPAVRYVDGGDVLTLGRRLCRPGPVPAHHARRPWRGGCRQHRPPGGDAATV